MKNVNHIYDDIKSFAVQAQWVCDYLLPNICVICLCMSCDAKCLYN